MIKRERQISVLIAFAVVAAATGAPQARSKVSQQEGEGGRGVVSRRAADFFLLFMNGDSAFF